MSLIVEDGTGMETAESYASVAQADARLAALGMTNWATLTTTEKEQALRRATVAMARAGRMPWLLLDFLLVSLAVYLLLSSANSIMFFQQGWHFIVLFGGLAYGYRWQSIGARSLP